jgi:hypothetical protein
MCHTMRLGTGRDVCLVGCGTGRDVCFACGSGHRQNLTSIKGWRQAGGGAPRMSDATHPHYDPLTAALAPQDLLRGAIREVTCKSNTACR